MMTTTDRYYTVIQCHGARSDGHGKGAVILWSLCAIFETEPEALTYIREVGKIVDGVPSHSVFSYPKGSDITAIAQFGQIMYYNGTEPFGPWQIQEDVAQGFEQTDI